MTVIQAHDFEFLNIWHHRFSFWKFILSNCKASKCDLHNELRIIINLSLFFLSIIPLHYVPRPPLNMATLTSCHKARQNLKQWITCLLHNCPGAALLPPMLKLDHWIGECSCLRGKWICTLQRMRACTEADPTKQLNLTGFCIILQH